MFEPVLTTNAVEVLRVAHERAVFDFKETYELESRAKLYELAKDVTAFANHLGGTILVGAIEGRGSGAGRATALPGLPGRWSLVPADLTRKLQSACELCRPVPIADAVHIELTAADQEEILGRDVQGEAVVVVAINVPPMLTTPIGCRSCDDQGREVGDAYRFPIRTVEGTRFLRPEELAFHMNSHERRVLLQLVDLPTGQSVTVWFDVQDGRRFPPRTCTIVSVSAELLVATLRHSIGEEQIDAEVPLTFVRAVWRDSATWNIAISGLAFEMDFRTQRRGFVPPGAVLL